MHEEEEEDLRDGPPSSMPTVDQPVENIAVTDVISDARLQPLLAKDSKIGSESVDALKTLRMTESSPTLPLDKFYEFHKKHYTPPDKRPADEQTHLKEESETSKNFNFISGDSDDTPQSRLRLPPKSKARMRPSNNTPPALLSEISDDCISRQDSFFSCAEDRADIGLSSSFGSFSSLRRNSSAEKFVTPPTSKSGHKVFDPEDGELVPGPTQGTF